MTGSLEAKVPLTAYLLAAVVFTALFWWQNSCGLRLTPDSHQYIAAAKSLIKSGELLNVEGSPLVHWPPLYSLILTVSAENFQFSHRWVHYFSLILSVFIWLKLLPLLLSQLQVWQVYWYALALATSTAWLTVGHFVWSEPVFILLMSLYIFGLINWLKYANAYWLYFAAIVGLLLPLQRLAGLFILAGSGIGLLVVYLRLIRTKFLPLFGHFALSASGFVVWWVWAAQFKGAWSPYNISASEQINLAVRALHAHALTWSQWLAPLLPWYSWVLGACWLLANVWLIIRCKTSLHVWLCILGATYLLLYAVSSSVTDVGLFIETDRFLKSFGASFLTFAPANFLTCRPFFQEDAMG